ncbi:DUF4231 domain-containing protein [Actinomadura roseirufa]|uniref:DUF4231 domain-containing protein n=1 Tax=Actinomadura roseirufa TaxID=2094049 RepID=UPI0013F17218|nr:DUF4231 domain-containing protein [Actinomadura roseirufa]
MGTADGTELPPLVTQEWRWYARSAKRARNAYFAFESITLLTAAAVPVAAGVWNSATVAAVLGAALVVLTGLRQIADLHHYWVSYTQVRYAIEHEVVLYSTNTAPYLDRGTSAGLLASTVLTIVAKEGQSWSSRRAQITATSQPLLSPPQGPPS